MILEIGRQRSPGAAGEMILAEAAETLIAEAIGVSAGARRRFRRAMPTRQSPGWGCGSKSPARRRCCAPSGALWLAAERTLIVADLHLEKGSAYAARGQLLPPYDTGDTLGRLAAEVARPDAAQSWSCWATASMTARARRAWRQETAAARTTRGRRRPDLGGRQPRRRGPRDLAGRARRTGGIGWPLSGPRTRSRRRSPARSPDTCILAPASGPGARVRRRCFVTDGERIVLPAFGAYAGGLNVLDAAYGRFSRARRWPPARRGTGSSGGSPLVEAGLRETK